MSASVKATGRCQRFSGQLAVHLLFGICFSGIRFTQGLGKCIDQQLTATIAQKTVAISRGIYKPGCKAYEISPDNKLSKFSYYLEISWWWPPKSTFFRVKGNMPMCDQGSYLAIYVSRNQSRRYIGRFCSDNVWDTELTPFEVYSFDGYAKLEFHGFRWSSRVEIKYRLLSKSSGGLKSRLCSSPIKLGTNQHGVLNSDNWPNQYSLSQKECEYRIELKTGQQITFFFIQVSLNYGYDDNCNEDDDFIKIRGSNVQKTTNDMPVIKDKLCTSTGTQFTTTYKHIRVTFKVNRGAKNWKRGVTYKGFIASYIIYGKVDKVEPETTAAVAERTFRPTTLTEHTSTNGLSAGEIAGITIGVLILSLACVASFCYYRQTEEMASNISRDQCLGDTEQENQAPIEPQVILLEKEANRTARKQQHKELEQLSPQTEASVPSFPANTYLMNTAPPTYSEAVS